MYYRIGLDIGITSVGWCVTETDGKGEPRRIVDLGSRIFDVAEVADTGASLALPRRLARGLRRRLRRRVLRVDCAKRLFEEQNVDLSDGGDDVNILRVKALDEKIGDADFARVLLLLIKRRGFKSNRINGCSKEEGKLLKATESNKRLMERKGYRTIGEMLVKEYGTVKNGKTVYETRNKGGEYTKTVLRSELENEIRLLFALQKGFRNRLATDENCEKILEIFNMQRNFDDGPGNGSPYSAEYKVGECTFEKGEERAPKASYTNERCVILQKINNLKIESNLRNELTLEEKKVILALANKQKKVTFGNVRKALALSDDETFSAITYKCKKDTDDIVTECEKAVFLNCEKSKSIQDCLADSRRNDYDIIDEIAVVLTHAKSAEKREKLIEENPLLCELSRAEIEKVIALNFDKFGNLSLKALKKIMPFLEDGYKYSEACEKAGYNHSNETEYEKTKLLNTKNIYGEIDKITSPVVKRSISQTLKVVNAIIRKYGSPVAINIELAREMNKSREERDKIKKENQSRFEGNKRLKEQIYENYNVCANGRDLLKYHLYEEQCGKCMYSGNPIATDKLFEPNYVQVDHIIPYSRCFNDSFNNKVLVFADENQRKGNQTPFEYLFKTDRWNGFVERVNATYANNLKKKSMFLKENIDENEWKDRALNDTRYISRFMHGLFNDYLLFEKAELGKKRVIAVNGVITSRLRHQWGIAKVREDGDMHHAVDAAVISCVSDGIIKKLSDFASLKETCNKKESVIDKPYERFVDELMYRCFERKEDMSSRLADLGYTPSQIKEATPVFVSRMPKRKGKGEIHAETIKSAKYKDEGIVVFKTPISKLKLKKTENGGYEIEKYFRPQDDKETYNLLLEKLKAAGGNAQTAFAEKVYKPCKDGKTPNEIKKVKLCEEYNAGVFLDKKEAFAGNGSMIRIDVFEKDGKYFCVPVYVADLYRGVLPNRAAIPGKKKSEWQETDDTFVFKFALYPNDLIYIKHKKSIVMAKSRDSEESKMPDTFEFNEGHVYFKGFDIATARARIITHDNCYETRVGLKTLKEIRKCNVGVLGDISFVKGEKRQKLSMK